MKRSAAGLALNGPNFNTLGTREPTIDETGPLTEAEAHDGQLASELDVEVAVAPGNQADARDGFFVSGVADAVIRGCGTGGSTLAVRRLAELAAGAS